MLPVRALPARDRVTSCGRLPSCGGIGPLSWLTDRSRVVRLASPPNAVGIDPTSAFCCSISWRSEERLAKPVGIAPLRPLLVMLSPATWPLSTSTPYQSAAAGMANQPSLCVQFRPPVVLNSSFSTVHSASGISVTAAQVRAGPTVRLSAADSPPPGSGLITLIEAVPSAATRSAGTAALSSVPFT